MIYSLISVAFYKRYSRKASVNLFLTCRKAQTKFLRKCKKNKKARGKDLMLKMGVIKMIFNASFKKVVPQEKVTLKKIN